MLLYLSLREDSLHRNDLNIDALVFLLDGSYSARHSVLTHVLHCANCYP